jgi:ribonuclease HI
LPFRTLAPIDRTPDRIVFTDASSFAGAAVTLESVNKVVHCMFSEQEIRESSTFRELKAVQFAIESLKTTLSGKFVKLYTDNQNVVHIVSVGSMKNELQNIAASIFKLCIDSNIILYVTWIPMSLNVTADFSVKNLIMMTGL